MRRFHRAGLKTMAVLTIAFAASHGAMAQEAPAAPLGATPPAEQFPQVEFVFEERVTLAPAVVVGDTVVGRRQYIPITGGEIAGPRLNGRVVPGGWDYQQIHDDGCAHLSADYFLEADDGAIIRILNQGLMCGGGPDGARSYMSPRFEAPEGPHGWLTRGSFIATIEPDGPPPGGGGGLGAIRIKVYQIK